jgi:hypothetical protein
VVLSPAFVAIELFVVIWTMAFAVGAIYLGGGSDAVRRQLPLLAVLAAVLVAVVIAVPVLNSILGDLAWGVVLVTMNVAVIGAWVYQSRRGEGPLVLERQRAAFRVPGFRALVIVWGAAIAVATILALLAGNGGD